MLNKCGVIQRFLIASFATVSRFEKNEFCSTHNVKKKSSIFSSKCCQNHTRIFLEIKKNHRDFQLIIKIMYCTDDSALNKKCYNLSLLKSAVKSVAESQPFLFPHVKIISIFQCLIFKILRSWESS